MSDEFCLAVRAAGRQMDTLRAEAFRIAKANNVGWWTDYAEIGTRFCFEDAKSREAFAASCENLGIPTRDAPKNER